MAHRGTELNFFGCFSLSEKLLSGFPFSHLQSKEKEPSHLPTESLSAVVLKFSLLTVEVLDALAAKTLADLSNTLLLIPAPFYLFLLTGVCLLLSGIGKEKKERVRIKYSRDSFFLLWCSTLSTFEEVCKRLLQWAAGRQFLSLSTTALQDSLTFNCQTAECQLSFSFLSTAECSLQSSYINLPAFPPLDCQTLGATEKNAYCIQSECEIGGHCTHYCCCFC